MAQKTWEKSLEDGFWLAFRMDTFLGVWTSFSVVLVYEDECITRFDSAHGKPHRDVLGRKNGLISKEWCGSVSLKEAFEHASRDLATNYRSYHTFYCEH